MIAVTLLGLGLAILAALLWPPSDPPICSTAADHEHDPCAKCGWCDCRGPAR